MFTDSKYFHFQYQPSGNQQAVWCRREQQPVRHTTRRSQKVHVYGGISIYGVTPLFFVEGTSGARGIERSVTAGAYINILRNCMIPAFHQVMDGKVTRPLFQQDGAPAHTAHATKTYLESCNLQLLQPWPSQSPDLSPIENAWSIL